MAKLERNACCPCGSGKKYKKCCLAKDEARATEQALRQRDADVATAREQAAFQARYRAANKTAAPTVGSWDFFDDRLDGLDDLSNSVIDLIRERRYEDALKACRRLLDEYPEVVDGLDRHAAVYEAMGEFAQARDYYQRALDFTHLPEQRDGFDEEGREWRREKITALKGLLGERSCAEEESGGAARAKIVLAPCWAACCCDGALHGASCCHAQVLAAHSRRIVSRANMSPCRSGRG